MYKLLIADDESTIREGIRDIIDWAGIGFEVCGVFEDGRDVLRHLEANSADAIITDIKMTFKSGIDIAKHVYSANLKTKVLFISGYNELDLAMSAIQYGVSGYILKPVDLDLLVDAMTKIKRMLDNEKENLLKRDILERYENDFEEIKDIFFGELVLGTMTSEGFVRAMFQIIYPDLDFDKCLCFSLNLALIEFANFIETRWEKTANEFYTCLSNCISIASSDIQFKMISKTRDFTRLIGILTAAGRENELGESIIISCVDQLQADVKDLFGLDTYVDRLRIYRGIPGLLANETLGVKYSAQPEDSDIIEQVKKYINAHITEDITLEDLSEKYFFSQYHFSRMFKAKTGETLIHYIMRMKIEKAIALLKQPHLKVYEICSLVGYKNNYHFTEVFKRFTGYTPNAYRNIT